ncbi:MAG: Nif3-like dinuclear metal center hexameric protein [Prevotellaceae bacterium]|nr:Nif3-like dinuclear metal center hexameric protein [Prevotellaceae bacterium]
MKIKEVVATLEEFAPLPLQDGYDNAGLQVGLTEAEVSGVLLCLDVTEAVLAEAAAKGCNLVVAHHPLLFRGLKQVGDTNYVERCVRMAVKNDITIYAAHTNLDNARGGVSFEMASRLGLKDVDFLQPDNKGGGSGVVAMAECPVVARDFVAKVKSVFGAECVMCNAMLDRPIGKVAICGGAGDFLLSRAIEVGADAFITGEMHYHLYFGHEQDIQIIVVGHYQSEQYTMQLFDRVLRQRFCDLKTFVTSVNTNPIIYV